MVRLNPEERVLDFQFDDYIKYCHHCCALEHQPHCPACVLNTYTEKVSIFDEVTLGFLRDSYFFCFVVAKEQENGN